MTKGTLHYHEAGALRIGRDTTTYDSVLAHLLLKFFFM